VFQGLLLFTLLACDTLIHYRVRWVRAVPSAPSRPMTTTAVKGA
jgi:simple sugar transport system permease protein